MEALSGSESPPALSLTPGWAGLGRVPSDYSQRLQVRPLGSCADLQLHRVGPEPNFSGFWCEHPSPCSHATCVTEGRFAFIWCVGVWFCISTSLRAIKILPRSLRCLKWLFLKRKQCEIKREEMDLGSDGPGFNTWLCHWPAVWLWERHATSLFLCL